jgi:hypothetical protein
MDREVKIDILGVDWTVVFKPDVLVNNSLCLGSCNPSNSIIEINTDYSKEKQKRTLIHELIHAIADLIAKPDLYADEETIDALTTGLYQVIKSNNLDLRKGL